MKKNLVAFLGLTQIIITFASAPKSDSAKADSKEKKEKAFITSLSYTAHPNGNIDKTYKTIARGAKSGLIQTLTFNKDGVGAPIVNINLPSGSHTDASTTNLATHISHQSLHRESMIVKFLYKMQQRSPNIDLVAEYLKVVDEIYTYKSETNEEHLANE